MEEHKKKHGFLSMVKHGLGYISEVISSSIFPPIAEGAETVMKVIEDRLIRIEKRMLRKVSSLLIIGFGGIFLIFALLSYLREFLGWSSAAAFFSVGIIIFVTGLLLKILESGR